MPNAQVKLNESTMGYEARPAFEASAPGVLVIHEVMGLNDYIREVKIGRASCRERV